jgi:hypothetical protein
MCFSAAASFAAAAIVGGIGIATLRNAAGVHRAVLPIAAFPVLFAVQQATEGFLWLDLGQPEPGVCRPILTHAFLAYAEVFWPVFAPLAALLIEPVPWRRRMIAISLAIGIALAGYLLFMMIANPYVAAIADGHIAYRNAATYPRGIEIPYVLATTISLLLSSHRLIQLLALIILAGFGVAYVSFYASYISIWCFFAAVASVVVYLFVKRAREPDTGDHDDQHAFL